MKKWFLTLLFCLVFSAAALADARYSQAIDDLPLMTDMQELPDSVVVFDTESGRIVEMTAKTAAKGAAVSAFYGQSLPPLGWVTQDRTTYWREGERLTLDLRTENGATLVHFSLSPKKE